MSGTTTLGQMPLTAMNNTTNALAFFVQQMLLGVNTCMPVKILSVTNSGDVSPVGMVDVQPLVNQIDGSGNMMAHGTIYGLPYFRIQGGTSAIIMDPQVNDIGLACFASRDVSSVKANKAQSNPGSRRTHNMADGFVVVGFLNGNPQQYIQFNQSGVTIYSPNQITVNAPTVTVEGTTVNVQATNINLQGNVASTGTFTNNGVNISSTHVHGGVQTGLATTLIPH